MSKEMKHFSKQGKIFPFQTVARVFHGLTSPDGSPYEIQQKVWIVPARVSLHDFLKLPISGRWLNDGFDAPCRSRKCILYVEQYRTPDPAYSFKNFERQKGGTIYFPSYAFDFGSMEFLQSFNYRNYYSFHKYDNLTEISHFMPSKLAKLTLSEGKVILGYFKANYMSLASEQYEALASLFPANGEPENNSKGHAANMVQSLGLNPEGLLN